MRLTRQDFRFDLPEELIAQEPPQERGASRLLVCDQGLVDSSFSALPTLLRKGDLLVRNNTRVLPARLAGRKATGGVVEILLERILGEFDFMAQVRSSKPMRAGQHVELAGGASAQVVGRDGDLVALQLDRPVREFFESYGELPLPPYIARAPDAQDRQRYQTVYARESGAVAAPTAGLHFSDELFQRCRSLGVDIADVTLHVGAGTFQPLRTDDLENHTLHVEWVSVPEDTVAAIAAARARGGRVVAIGTTVVRSLESAATADGLQSFQGETRLFIRPGYRFRIVDALVTNFHLSESTLLMLVCAFGGRERVLSAYAHAVQQRYRFFSYGDAMWITPNTALAGH